MYFYLEKMKSYLFEACLVGLLIKSMVTGSTIADALVLISLVISITYAKHYLVKPNVELSEEQATKLKEVESKVNNLMAANSIKRGIIGEIKK
jgi:hypothetical protein